MYVSMYECVYFYLCNILFFSAFLKCVAVAVLAVRPIFMTWSFMRSMLQREEMKLPHVSDSVQHVVCCPNPSPAPHYQIPIT